MSDNVFRMVIAAAVGVTFLVFLVQAFLVMGIFRAVRKIQEKVEPLSDKGEKLIEKLTPVADTLGRTWTASGRRSGSSGPRPRRSGRYSIRRA